jgi:isopenicillin N synthase-like dioxygenase
MSWVPVIDLGDAGAPAAVAEAASRCGFLSIVGHGVAPEVVESAWAQAQALFDLPLADKMTVAMPTPGYPYGYSPLLGETLAASLGNAGPADLKESFAIGPVDPPRHAMTDSDESFAWSPNLWPAALPGMRTAWETYYREISALAARLLSVMAVGLELPADYFEPMIDRHTSAMRALNYPSPSAVADGQLGAGAHTDYGTLTILLADPLQGGLQVQDTSGMWQPVDPLPGSFVVNLGDAMARWTNDRWRSTLHRVVVPTARRQSIAFFHNANWDAVIECLPTCQSPDDPPRYSPIEAGPHLMSKFRSTVNY